jgi:hypothetical protein
MNPSETCEMKLPQLQQGNYHLEPMVGNGKFFKATVSNARTVRFSLSLPNGFTLYRYVKMN